MALQHGSAEQLGLNFKVESYMTTGGRSDHQRYLRTVMGKTDGFKTVHGFKNSHQKLMFEFLSFITCLYLTDEHRYPEVKLLPLFL